MSNYALNKKVEMNYEIAKYAEKKQYFDVAISRYYYALYQKMLIYINSLSKDVNFDNWYNNIYKPEKKKIEKYSHRVKIAYFLYLYRIKNPQIESTRLQVIQNLRMKRNKADYYNFLFKKVEFEDEFKNDFVIVWNLIKV